MAGYSEVTSHGSSFTFHGSSITLHGSSFPHLLLLLTVEGFLLTYLSILCYKKENSII